MNVELVNENSVIIYFSDTVTEETADTIVHACSIFRSRLSDCLRDIVPSYTSVLLSFHPCNIGLKAFVRRIYELLKDIESRFECDKKSHEIVLPVYYGEEVALDHLDISRQTELPFLDIVKIHTSGRYRVFAIGFAPGFAYLGNTHPKITIPRRESPRPAVPKGSVAIADRQTAIYPRQSPGGWQIIGRTPLNLFDVKKRTLSYFEVGDEVRFESIDRETFLDMGGQL